MVDRPHPHDAPDPGRADELDARLTGLARSIAVPPAPTLDPSTPRAVVGHRATAGWRRPLAVAAALLLLAGGAAALAANVTGGDDPAVDVRSGPTTTRVPAPATGPARLAELLAAAGVDLATAPAGLLEPGQAQVCGLLAVEQTLDGDRTDADDVANSRCFLDAHLAGLPAVLVEIHGTVEGDPIVTVHRTATDGTYDSYVDSTRDAFGSGRWWYGSCERLTTRFAQAPDPNTIPPWRFQGQGCAEGTEVGPTSAPATALGAMPFVPTWFADRDPVPVCGIDVRVEDDDQAHRTCFAAEAANTEASELAYGATGDEGERVGLWYRSLGPGRIEVIERQLPHATDGQPAGWGSWLRYACTTIGLRDEPDTEVHQLPSAHTTDACTVVDEASGTPEASTGAPVSPTSRSDEATTMLPGTTTTAATAPGPFDLGTLTTLLVTEGPEGYGGLWQEDGGGTVHVQQVGRTAEVEAITAAYLVTHPDGPEVAFDVVANSLEDLEAVVRHLADDGPGLARDGFDIASWGIDARANRVVVEVRAPSSTSKATLAERYGADLIHVVEAGSEDAAPG